MSFLSSICFTFFASLLATSCGPGFLMAPHSPEAATTYLPLEVSEALRNSAPILQRAFDENDVIEVSGTCDPAAGSILLTGTGMSASTTLTCDSQGRFRVNLNYAGAAPRLTNSLGAKDLALRQSNIEKNFRIYKYLEGPGVQVVATAAEVAMMNAIAVPDALAILGTDLDLSLISATGNWTPIALAGTFEGNDHSIANMDLTTTAFYGGFFSELEPTARIQNFTLGGNVVCRGFCGGMFGWSDPGSVLDNVHFSGNVTNTAIPVAGGLGGQSFSSINNCSVAGTLITASDYSGGVVANSTGADISNCTSSMSIDSSNRYAGGIVGSFNSGSINNVTVNADVSSTGEAAGIASIVSSATIEDCTYAGTTSGGFNVGGVVGRSGSVTDAIRRCRVSGLVRAPAGNSVGGLVGRVQATMVVQDSYSTANITTATGYGGGLVGIVLGTGTLNLQRLYTTGSVSGSAGSSGPILGIDSDLGMVTAMTDVFYLSSAACSGCTNARGTSKNLTELSNTSTYTGWDFSTVWQAPQSAPPLLR